MDFFTNAIELEGDVEEFEDVVQQLQSFQSMFFTPIPSLHDAIFVAVFVVIGSILNSVILRCYWSVKSVASGYVRAPVDQCCLAYTMACVS